MNKHKIGVYICMVYLPIVLANMNPKAYDLSLSDLRALKTVADDTGDVASRMQSFAAAIRNIGASLEAKLRKIGTSDDVASSREYQFGDSGLEQHLEITDNRITALVAKIAVTNRRLDEIESKLAAFGTHRSELEERCDVKNDLIGQLYATQKASTKEISVINDSVKALIGKVDKLEGQVSRELEERVHKNENEISDSWLQIDLNTEKINILANRVNKLEVKTFGGVRCGKGNFDKLPNDELKLPSLCSSVCGKGDADGVVIVNCPNRRDEEFEKAKLQQQLDYEITKTPSNTPDIQPSEDERPDQDIQ